MTAKEHHGQLKDGHKQEPAHRQRNEIGLIVGISLVRQVDFKDIESDEQQRSEQDKDVVHFF